LDDGFPCPNLCTDGKTRGLRGPLHGTPVQGKTRVCRSSFLAVAAYTTSEGMKRCDSRKRRARLALERAWESPTVTLNDAALGPFKPWLLRGVPKQSDTNRHYQNLRRNVDADRDVLAAFFAIRNFCVGVDLQFAFHGRVLIDEERHCFGFSLLLRELLTCGGLIRCYG
jgi:hypothetical protein